MYEKDADSLDMYGKGRESRGLERLWMRGSRVCESCDEVQGTLVC